MEDGNRRCTSDVALSLLSLFSDESSELEPSLLAEALLDGEPEPWGCTLVYGWERHVHPEPPGQGPKARHTSASTAGTLSLIYAGGLVRRRRKRRRTGEPRRQREGAEGLGRGQRNGGETGAVAGGRRRSARETGAAHA